jgi:hypothetical protein
MAAAQAAWPADPCHVTGQVRSRVRGNGLGELLLQYSLPESHRGPTHRGAARQAEASRVDPGIAPGRECRGDRELYKLAYSARLPESGECWQASYAEAGFRESKDSRAW